SLRHGGACRGRAGPGVPRHRQRTNAARRPRPQSARLPERRRVRAGPGSRGRSGAGRPLSRSPGAPLLLRSADPALDADADGSRGPPMTKSLTILVCTHNRADLLPGALESLEGQSLDRSRFEVLVVDNASTDDTAEVIAETVKRGRIDIRGVF